MHGSQHFCKSILVMLTGMLFIMAALSAHAVPLGTAFSYQGYLDEQGQAANGLFDFEFKLTDAAVAGATLATVAVGGVQVSDGIFTVSLDFGDVPFAGDARWLDIGVRKAGQVGYTSLVPRQAISPAPYALFAQNGAAGGGGFWTQVSPGTIYTEASSLGIGMKTPASGVALHVKNDFESIRLDGASPFISFYDGTNYRGYLYMTGLNMYLYNRSAGNIFFGTSSSSRMTIDSSGNVGVGTSLPELRMHVANGLLSGGNFNSNSIAGFEKSGGNAYVSIMTSSASETGLIFADETDAQNAGIIYNNGATPQGMQFRTNGNVTRMVIDSQGDVGIGRTNPLRPIHVKSRNGGDEYGIMIERSGSAVDWELSVFGGKFNFFYDGSQTATASISTTGIYSSSDGRLKKNIKPYASVLKGVSELVVSTYEFIVDGDQAKPSLGLIGQDVAKIFPEVVQQSPGRDGIEYYAIDYSKTGVLALKAIQELQLELQQREQDNLALKARVEELGLHNAEMEERLLTLELAIGNQR